MQIINCKLKKSIQKILEFFVAEVSARTVADLLEIQLNAAALFYHKICQVIDHHLALEADEIFEVISYFIIILFIRLVILKL